jgi:DNA-binding NtrC family response regulator
MPKRILIVDDDAAVVSSLALELKQAGFLTGSAFSPGEALVALEKARYDLVIQDMNFSRRTTGEEGIDLLRKIRAHHPHLPVILITAWGTISLAVEGIKAGASDFITKPWSNEQLIPAVKTIMGLADARAGSEGAPPLTRTELEKMMNIEGLIGENSAFLHVLEVIGRVSPTDASVLIIGESGTGKELLAEAIHRNSHRKKGPFVKVNLGGISPSLFESEMFGHVRGAFTDAKSDRTGRFELANGGTIFLDEVGDLDLSCQVKLLRVLQDRTYEALGSSVSKKVDVRIISATNRALPEMISRGEFREDLLYRLNLITLQAPPLRDRLDDIPLLVRHFLDALGAVYRRSGLDITEAGLQRLRQLPWPGNVRELRQIIERSVLLSGGSILDVSDLERAYSMQAPGSGQFPDKKEGTLEEMERAMVEKAMSAHGGNVTLAAEALGISPAALYRRLKKFGIEL